MKKHTKRRILKTLRLLADSVLPILFWLSLIFGFDAPYIAVLTVICAIAHELGHIAAIYLFTENAARITGHSSGFRIKRDSTLSYKKEIMILLGIYSSVMFISIFQDCKAITRFLDFINKYSFQIYLLHTIFTAGTRIILLRLNIAQWWIHILLGTALGLAFSVLAAVIAKKVKCLNFFFFPSKVYTLNKELHIIRSILL